jgi:trans-aconitate methyltransferase
VSRDVAEFSEVGDRYGEQLSRGLRLTGENAEFFARQRIARVGELVAELGGLRRVDAVRAVLDFGCGLGASLPTLGATFPDARVVGFEPADGLRAAAVLAAERAGATVVSSLLHEADGFADVAYCNGVFHHVAPAERTDVFASFATAMAPGGLAFVWENSPYNPGTRLIMSRIPFDRGAHLLTPGALRRALRRAGLEPVRTEYHFVFPHALRALRPLEPRMRSLPFGGQYVVVARRG